MGATAMPYALITGLICSVAATRPSPAGVVQFAPEEELTGGQGNEARTNSLVEQAQREAKSIGTAKSDLVTKEANNTVKDPAELCQWLKGPHDKSEEPLCSQGEYSWTCVDGGYGERVQCPQRYPMMCEDKTCFSGEYCCTKNVTLCKLGLRKCEPEKIVKARVKQAEAMLRDHAVEEQTISTTPDDDKMFPDDDQGKTTTGEGPIENATTTDGTKETPKLDVKGQVTEEDQIQLRSNQQPEGQTTTEGQSQPRSNQQTEGQTTTEEGPNQSRSNQRTEGKETTRATTSKQDENDNFFNKNEIMETFVSSQHEGKVTTTRRDKPASPTGAESEDTTTTASVTSEVTTTEKQVKISTVPDCATVAPLTFPGGCDLQVSGFACYADKNVVADLENGHIELDVQWACSSSKDQEDLTDSSCRSRFQLTHYDSTIGGRKVVFKGTPGIYNGLCEFRASEPSTMAKNVEAGSTTDLKATTTASMVNGDTDGTGTDQATTTLPNSIGVENDKTPDQTLDMASNSSTNDTGNATKSRGSRPCGTSIYLSACLWIFASPWMLRSMQ